MTPENYTRIDDTLDCIHDDVENRFIDDCGVLTIVVRADGEGFCHSSFRASGNTEVLASGLGDAMEKGPELVLLLAKATEYGNASNILRNLEDYLGDQTDPDNPFGLD